MKRSPLAVVWVFALTTGWWSARAGDLTPPVGPVAPTHKTLTEAEPRIAINATNTPGDADSLFKIISPGSYYLTGNVQGVAAKHGIEIGASGVTLDLSGFDLLGVAGSLDGVSATAASLRNIAVVNGSVRNWGDEGVDLATSGVTNCRVADVLANGNTGNGLFIGVGGTVANCSAQSNSADGINAGVCCAVTNCSAYLNTGNGITIGGSSTITNCAAFANTSNGINTSTTTGTGCTITDCSARLNTLDGIRCVAGCLVRANTCSLNGNGGDGAGIHATGADNRIEGNNCTTADRGIDVDVAGNIIIKNTCSGNTLNWDIAASNKCLVILGVNAGAISGDSGGASPGSTDPNANFTY